MATEPRTFLIIRTNRRTISVATQPITHKTGVSPRKGTATVAMVQPAAEPNGTSLQGKEALDEEVAKTCVGDLVSSVRYG